MRTGIKGGTFAYKAPEAFRNKYSKASEVYSFAIIGWELLVGQRPWQQDAQGRPYDEAGLMGAVLYGTRPELKAARKGSSTEAMLAGIVRRCWQQEPNRRPTFAQLELQLRTASVGRPPSMPQVYEKLFKSTGLLSPRRGTAMPTAQAHV